MIYLTHMSKIVSLQHVATIINAVIFLYMKFSNSDVYLTQRSLIHIATF